MSARTLPVPTTTNGPLRLAAAAILAVHGLIHLVGFVVPWGLAVVDGFPYRTALFGDALVVGDLGAKLLGLAWLVVAAGFVVAGVAVARRAWWATRLAVGLALVSIGLCVLGLPEAGTGIPVNLAILAGAAWSSRRRTPAA